ncbi:MAG TPA: 7,8-didemethyl-8-hydroxy-5-deazariboflavin synthase CofG [Kofleriaceae bacterium]|nr:7,8-didemethyl-8-hydroxy-5-deazariboflavin synthase CofG [Kofleriaceae bacterium]
MREAAAKRDARWGRRITYSPKVFLPLTNLCRDVCDYCAFRRSPKDPGAHTMTRSEVEQTLARAKQLGCTEALFCLGDRPETAFPSYRELLASWGFGSTVDYLVWACERAIEAGLHPHTNAGVLTRDELARLQPVNASMGLMLESTSERLCAKGGPHAGAPDKRPRVRLQMHEDAGALGIPFTSGILVGIGETEAERIATLQAIRESHARHGHIQEVIVQPFRTHAGTRMARAPEATDDEYLRAIALARILLPDDVTVQAPPNLSRSIAPLVDAGINDLGGISPLTPDFINREHAWPHIDGLAKDCEALGRTLVARLPVHEGWIACAS